MVEEKLGGVGGGFRGREGGRRWLFYAAGFSHFQSKKLDEWNEQIINPSSIIPMADVIKQQYVNSYPPIFLFLFTFFFFIPSLVFERVRNHDI